MCIYFQMIALKTSSPQYSHSFFSLCFVSLLVCVALVLVMNQTVSRLVDGVATTFHTKKATAFSPEDFYYYDG